MIPMQALICGNYEFTVALLRLSTEGQMKFWRYRESLNLHREFIMQCSWRFYTKLNANEMFVCQSWANMKMSDTFHTWLHVHKSVHQLAFVSLDLNVRCCTIGSIHHVFIFLKMGCDMERMCSEYMSCHYTLSTLPWFLAVNSEKLELSQCNFTWFNSLIIRQLSRLWTFILFC